jgi:serine/threonine-protein kinase
VVGELPDAEAGRLEQHLTRCRTCLGRVETLQSHDSFVEDLAAAGRTGEQLPTPVDEGLIADLCRLGRSAADTPPESTQEVSDWLAPAQGPEEMGCLGPFHVLKVLGRGGMGVVFLARQTRPQRLVALKMILAATLADRPRLERFRSETEVLARFAHPNLVQVYEVGEHKGRPYYAMEFLDGGSLGQKLAVAPLPARAAAQLLETLAGAMQHAHDKGIIHRDLKPSNILLTAGGVPKISDFGLAKQLAGPDESAAEFRTESGAILGTPGYMAPEQAGVGGAVRPRTCTPWGRSSTRR